MSDNKQIETQPQQVDATGEVIRSRPKQILDLTTAKKLIEILKRENAQLKDKINELKKENTRIQDNFTKLSDDVDQLELLPNELSSLSVSDPIDSVDGPQASGTDEYEELNKEIVTLNERIHELETENAQLKEDLEKRAQKVQKHASEKCPGSCTKDVFINILNNDFNESVCPGLFCTEMHDKLKEKREDLKPLSCMTFASQLLSLDLVVQVHERNYIKPGEHKKVLQESVEKLKGVVGMLLYSGKSKSKAGHCIKVPAKIPNFDVASFFDVQEQKPWDGWEEKDVCYVRVLKINNEAESFKNIVSAAQDNDELASNQTKKFFDQEQSAGEGSDGVTSEYS